jgi:hypothetical protein
MGYKPRKNLTKDTSNIAALHKNTIFITDSYYRKLLKSAVHSFCSLDVVPSSIE